MSLRNAINAMREQEKVHPVHPSSPVGEPLEAAPIKEVHPVHPVHPEKLKSCRSESKDHQQAPMGPESRNGEIPFFKVLGEPVNPPDFVQADPMATWEFVRTRIQAGWRAEFTPPGPDGRQAITWHPPGEWTPDPPAPGGAAVNSDRSLPGNDFRPLSEGQLAGLVVTAAAANGVDPLAVWLWLAPEDIEALRSGDPDEVCAFRAGVATACAGGRLTPDGGHSLPFPKTPWLDAKRYETVEFTEYRLTSGRRIAFRLAIPKARYDGFEVLKLLDQREGPP